MSTNQVLLGDNPMRIYPECLTERFTKPNELGQWYASIKWDGWRLSIRHNEDGSFAYRGKHGQDAKKVPAHLRQAVESLPWPKPLTLDCEFMGMRCTENVLRPFIVVFDILEYGKPGLWEAPFAVRWELVDDRTALGPVLAAIESSPAPVIFAGQTIVDAEHLSAQDFFVQQLQDPLSEGIVLRHRLHRHSGKGETSALLLKCKYREAPR